MAHTKKISIMILAVLCAVVAAGAFFYGARLFRKGQPGVFAPSFRNDAGQYELMHAVMKEAEIKRRAVRTQFKSLKRDPFTPKPTVAPRAAPASSITLSGIMWSEKDPKAMIGDAIVRKGERVGSVTVVEIRKKSVVLNDGVKTYEVPWE